MEIPSFSVSYNLLVVGVIVIGLAKLISSLYEQINYWARRGVPSVPSLPVLGSGWKMFTRQISMPDIVMQWYNLQPDVKYIGTMDFATPSVMVRDPDLIRDIGIKHFEHFPDHESFIDEKIDPVFGKNVFSLKGDRWKEMRNTLSPTFTASKMRFMFDLVSECSKQFTDYLYTHPEQFSQVDLKELFTRYTNDVIATAAFGISVNSLKDRENEFYVKGADATKFSGFFRLLKFLFFRASPQLSKLLGLKFLSRDTGNFFQRVVAETVSARDAQKIVRPDMIHLLMQARDKDKLTTHQLTIDDIVAQAFIFFLAGFDTSSTLMSYIGYELAVNPDVQEKLREEVDSHMAEGNGVISYEELLKMDYMEMVVSETLRKHPPTVLTDRICAQKFELPAAGPGYDSVTVNPGDKITFPVFGLHRDPKYFPDPEKFDPERFNEQNKDKVNPYAYLPFGLGPRKCIGNRFALMETKILVANLVHRFNLKRTEKTMVPIVYSKQNFSIIPDEGIWIGLEKREGIAN
ncbi:cytochrome P450 9e2-like [Lasioglossum baleicum]|uniref:cytochrome P450 9e2-like n=1 Tax=Lasioglossum baleicum TaxID=434251 RepID=UPI003FCC7157